VTQFEETVISTSEDSAPQRRCPSCNIEVPNELERCPQDGTQLSQSPQNELDKRYELLEPIGKGGMSVVYKARHRLMGNLVAIKLLQDKLTNNPAHLKRFQVEAQAAGRLDHSNLIKVHDFGVLSSGFTFLVMDFADGHSLSDLIQTNGMLDGKRALPLFTQICEGLAHAHSKGILHRDLKPSNVIVVQDEQIGEKAKVVDFGIAKVTAEDGADSKLTATGEVFGSPYYMSPEQCTGIDVDRRSDVYSMGCLMYEALSGKLPLQGSNVFETIHKQVGEVPEPLSKHVSDPVSVAMSPVVAKALEKDPAHRYQNFVELLDDLKAISEGRTVAEPRKQLRLSKRGVVLGSSGLLLSLGGLLCWNLYAAAPHVVPAPKVADQSMSEPLPTLPKVAAASTVGDLNGRMTDQQESEQWHQFAITHKIRLNYRKVGAAQLARIAEDPNATDVHLPGNPAIDDAAITVFKGHPSIETLNLTGTSITGNAFETFVTMPKLRMLMIGNTQILAGAFRRLAEVKSLNEVWINDLNLVDDDLERLAVLPRLHRLKVDDSPRLSDGAIEILLRKLPSLSFLSFRRVPFSDDALRQLASVRHVRDIKLLGSHVNPLTLAPFEADRVFRPGWDVKLEPGSHPFEAREKRLKNAALIMPSLVANKEFKAGGPTFLDSHMLGLAESKVAHIGIRPAPSVTDEGLLGLASDPYLVRLAVPESKATDRFVECLPTIPSLQFLDLSKTKITSKGFEYFAYCPKLTEVLLADLHLTNADVAKLPRLQLRRINLSDNPAITDSAVPVIEAKLPQLQWLYMNGTGITDSAIPSLLKIRNLKELFIYKTKITEAGAQKLFAGGITVHSDYPSVVAP
jgi:serine/threonine protein kinase